MFIIRLAFWAGLAVVLLPSDERQQAQLYGTAVGAVERVTTFCDRNAETCAAGADLWAVFVRKAEFGARMVADLVRSGGRKDEAATPVSAPGPHAKRRPEARLVPTVQGTLTSDDMTPAWRGQAQRAGT